MLVDVALLIVRSDALTFSPASAFPFDHAQVSELDLLSRYEILDAQGLPVELDQLPWRRAASGETFDERQIWRARDGSARQRLRVRGWRDQSGAFVLLLAGAEGDPAQLAAQRTMYDAAVAFANGAALSEFPRSIIAAACAVVGAHRGGLRVFTDSGGHFADVVCNTVGEVPRDEAGLPLSEADFVDALQRTPVETGSLIAASVRDGDETVGKFFVADKGGGAAFTPDDKRALERFCDGTVPLLRVWRRLERNERNRERLQMGLDQAPVGIMFFRSSDGAIEYANPAAERIIGRPVVGPVPMSRHPEIHGLRRPDGGVITAEDLPSGKALRGIEVHGAEVLVTRPDGELAPMRVAAAPWRREGVIVGALVAFEDISDEKRLDQLREEFQMVVAHDLRNPIQSILLRLDSLGRDPIADTVTVPVTACRAIRKSLLSLLRMVGDLSDAGQIESRRLQLDRQPVHLGGAVEQVLDAMHPLLGQRHVDLSVEGQPPRVLVDRVRLEEILSNLIENAAKYSDESAPIFLRVRAEHQGATLTVTDRGIGISEDELPRLFDRFYQARRARSRKSGLGLGLYITRGLVEAHGGRIWVDSAPGSGSSFHVWFPAAPE